MILTDLKEALRVQRARCQPLLSFTRLSVPDLREATRREHFPEPAEAPAVRFVRGGPPACICCPEGQAPVVCVPEILNRADVPPGVFRRICLAAQKLRTHVESLAPSIRRAQRGTPEDLAALLARLLAKDPADRPATSAEAAATLAPFVAGADLLKVALAEGLPPRFRLERPDAACGPTDDYRA